jgi:predicted transcriptional regulator
MSAVREKFATQVDAELLESVRQLARSEGRQIQAVVEDALRDHIEAKQSSRSRGREHVMKAYLKSTERYSGLYKKLAE